MHMRTCVSKRWGVLAALALMMMAAAAEPARAQTTFTVNTTSDTNDGTCDASHCSLREAITAANAAAGADTIEFAILPAGGVHVIQISGTELPALQDDLVIDGYTQAGASPNTSATGGLDTQLRIQLQPITPSILACVSSARASPSVASPSSIFSRTSTSKTSSRSTSRSREISSEPTLMA